MNPLPASYTEFSAASSSRPQLQGLSRSQRRSTELALNLLKHLQFGELHLQLPDQSQLVFGKAHPEFAPAHLQLRDWEVFNACTKHGDIGFCEAYIDGLWTSRDLSNLLQLFIRNRQHLDSLIYGNWWGRLWFGLKHKLNRNNKRGSKKNIHAHYDIGNPFYQLWLDTTMSYSSALFDAGMPQQSMEQAQLAKYQRVLDELNLPAGSKLLEIGCGWGGFAELAARQGHQLTGITLSQQQLSYAQQRLQQQVPAAACDFRLQDYRDTAGEYDGIASIEMIEAVGQEYWDDYFACLARNLRQGGRACIQSIVIAPELFERYQRGSDFIQQYIFPGGMLPTIPILHDYAARHGFMVRNCLPFGLDYARTLAYWRERYLQKLPELEQLAYDTRFNRTWEMYLAYCEAGFRAHNLDVVQITLQRI